MRPAVAFGLIWLGLSAVACSDSVTPDPSATNVGADDVAATGDGLAMPADAPDDSAAPDVVVAVAVDAAPGADVAPAPDATALPDVPGAPDGGTAVDAAPPVEVSAALCGNGYCDIGENSNNCSADCKGMSWTCGDGVCDPGEQFYCENDCTKPVCGDGKCQPGEQSAGCKQDCPATVVCGDNICGTGENGQNCPKDCGIGTWTCGDGKCDIGEQFYCFKDCQTAAPDPLGCVQAKCANDYGKCVGNAGCVAALQCMIGCKGDWGCLQGCVQSAGNNGAAAVQVAFCGQQNGCM